MEEKRNVEAASKKWEVVVFTLGKDAFAINVNQGAVQYRLKLPLSSGLLHCVMHFCP